MSVSNRYQGLLIATVVVSLLSPSTLQAEKNKYVLAIGIDGMRTDALDVAKTPNIDKLIENGSASSTAQILGTRYRKNDTISGPGWTSFLTGVWADRHGVHDNDFKGHKIDQFPHFFSLLKQQFPEYKTASYVDWHPIDRFIVSGADIRVAYKASGADGYAIYDQRIATQVSKALARNDVRTTMVYFGAVDETGHKYGFHPANPQYVQSIETVDRHVGTLMSAIGSRSSYDSEDWLILISSDHGGQGTGHGGGHDTPTVRHVYLIVSGNAAKKGRFDMPVYIVDLPVTALVHLGVTLQPKWRLDGRAVGLK